MIKLITLESFSPTVGVHDPITMTKKVTFPASFVMTITEGIGKKRLDPDAVIKVARNEKKAISTARLEALEAEPVHATSVIMVSGVAGGNPVSVHVLGDQKDLEEMIWGDMLRDCSSAPS